MMNRFLAAALLCFATFVVVSCNEKGVDLSAAINSIDVDGYTENIKVLASDEFEGRSPSSPGEEKTVNFLKSKFEGLGLKPGNGNSFFQNVSLVKVTPYPTEIMAITGGSKDVNLKLRKDFVALTRQVQDEVNIEDSELVFAGFGVVAPEYGWNDYEGLDVKGKTVIVMVNDPGFATKDSTMFNGRTMTYYGRWTYKYEEAARQGATGVIVIHETAPAGYPWAVVGGGWTGPQFYMEAADKNMSRCPLEGWVSAVAIREIFSAAGMDYAAMTAAALKPGFKAKPMGLTYSMTIRNEIESSTSRNVLALLPGTDLKDEYIIYSAHWDHFGVNPNMSGDNIFNGAADNATGTAALIELAEAFTKLPTAPRRSIVFLAVTAEEQGLIGSAYYAANPIFPITKTAAALNMDALNIFGKMKDITIVGEGNSELDEYVYAVAKKQNRYIRPDPDPEKGIFYRSDHFSFAKQGIPALYTKMGIDHIEHGEAWTTKKKKDWTSNTYHKVTDEYTDEWDLSGAVDDIRLMFQVGQMISMESAFPNWKEGTEFKAKRDADMSAAK